MGLDIEKQWIFGDNIVQKIYSDISGYTYSHYSKKHDKWFTSIDPIFSEKKIDDIAGERENELLEKYNNEINL